MYLAPEFFEEFHFSNASNSFALAIILYQLISNRRSIKIGRLRYACYNDLLVDDLSNEIQSYFINSLDTNPLNRPTIDQIYDQLQTDDFKSAFGDINEEEVTKYIEKKVKIINLKIAAILTLKIAMIINLKIVMIIKMR